MNFRKIDALIAEHFFGWVDVAYRVAGYGDGRNNTDEGPWYEWEGRPDSRMGSLLQRIPRYSFGIGKAWEVVDKLHATDNKIDICSYVDSVGVVTYDVQIVDARSSCFNVQDQSLLPLAICLAALKLKGVPYED